MSGIDELIKKQFDQRHDISKDEIYQIARKELSTLYNDDFDRTFEYVWDLHPLVLERKILPDTETNTTDDQQ